MIGVECDIPADDREQFARVLLELLCDARAAGAQPLDESGALPVVS